MSYRPICLMVTPAAAPTRDTAVSIRYNIANVYVTSRAGRKPPAAGGAMGCDAWARKSWDSSKS